MNPELRIIEVEERMRIFRALVPYFGSVQRSAFFQRTGEFIRGIDRIHNFIEGIYKPAGARYALSVSSMLTSPYHDQLFYNADGSWVMLYSPKDAPMQHAANASLLLCMRDAQPVIVTKQVSDKSSREGARHRLLGLGAIEAFDDTTSLFRIRGVEWEGLSNLLQVQLTDDFLPVALRLESLDAWKPFAPENRAVYQVSRERRDAAFRSVVLANYEHTCAVTGQRFHSPRHTEADGAHIIGKDVRGTDDPRNGIALSKSAHWAFDRGIFTISDQYEIVVNPKVRQASAAKFPLLELDGKPILLPADSCFFPHADALAWHRAEVFDRLVL